MASSCVSIVLDILSDCIIVAHDSNKEDNNKSTAHGPVFYVEIARDQGNIQRPLVAEFRSPDFQGMRKLLGNSL